jgi:S1-C subfamily serine protease
VIAFMGSGHTGPGAVPHQLRALGIDGTAVLLPWDREPGCAPPKAGTAQAFFGVAPTDTAAAAERPRLGIALVPGEGPGARIERVQDGSVAAAAGLRTGDVVIEIAGREVRRNADVLNTIRRQAPGTWLPMRVRRDGAEHDLVAKFPPR